MSRTSESDLKLKMELAELDPELVEALFGPSDESFLRALVRFLRRKLASDFVFVGESGGVDWGRIYSVAIESNPPGAEAFDYDLEGTPCAEVMGKGAPRACCHLQGVAEQFPQDAFLVDGGFQSYAGIPLRDDSGSPLGLIVSLSRRPLKQTAKVIRTLECFHDRAALAIQNRKLAHEVTDLLQASTHSKSHKIFRSLMEILSNGLQVRGAFIAEIIPSANEELEAHDARVVACCLDGQPLEADRYVLRGTPCEEVYRSERFSMSDAKLAMRYQLPSFLEGRGVSVYAGRALHDSAGKAIGHFAVLHDSPVDPRVLSGHLYEVFTSRLGAELRRKHAEDERNQLIQELKVQNEQMESFIYTVSHDLRSPLISISGLVGFLQRDLRRGDTVRIDEDLIGIRSAIGNMDALLKDLLELSRIGRMVNPPEEVSMARIVSDALESCAGSIRDRGAEVVVAIDPGLPGVKVDRLRIVQVLQNLIENAVKSSEAGQAPKVEIRCAPADERGLVTYVRDHGIGIDPRYFETIFDLFHQLDADAQGSGVGLALVKRIIEAHKGRVWVESEGEGQGATFFFSLPLD